MSIFLSWSGPRSKAIAECFKEQLKLFEIESFLSSEDIRKGQSWLTEIGDKLDKYSGGIIFLTPTNLEARWINFEAGAIAKHGNSSRVCTYLIDLDAGDVPPPLSFFQNTKTTKEDTGKLFCDLKEWVIDGTSSPETVRKIFDAVAWEEIEKTLKSSEKLDVKPSRKSERKVDDKVDELLGMMRMFDSSNNRMVEMLSEITSDRSISSMQRKPVTSKNTRVFGDLTSMHTPDHVLGKLHEFATISGINQEQYNYMMETMSIHCVNNKEPFRWNSLLHESVIEQMLRLIDPRKVHGLLKRLDSFKTIDELDRHRMRKICNEIEEDFGIMDI